jgi:hypothetical protein
MGFTSEQAQAALISCNGHLESAADWLFEHVDAGSLGSTVAEASRGVPPCVPANSVSTVAEAVQGADLLVQRRADNFDALSAPPPTLRRSRADDLELSQRGSGPSLDSPRSERSHVSLEPIPPHGGDLIDLNEPREPREACPPDVNNSPSCVLAAAIVTTPKLAPRAEMNASSCPELVCALATSVDALEASSIAFHNQHLLLQPAPVEVMRKLAESWGVKCASDVEAGTRDGIALVIGAAGLAAAELPDRIFDANPATCVANMVDAAKEAPVPGSLATLSNLAARRTATRLNRFFKVAITGLIRSGINTSVGGQSLALLTAWLPVLAGSALRSLRHAATAAGLGAFEAIQQEKHSLAQELTIVTKQLVTSARGTRSELTNQRLDRLCANKAEIELSLKILHERTNSLSEQLLKPRLRDTSSAVRRLAVATSAWLVENDCMGDQAMPWPERVLRAFCDPNSEVRLRAIEVACQWFDKPGSNIDQEAEHNVVGSQEKNDARQDAYDDSCRQEAAIAPRSARLPAVAPHLASLLVERSCDVEPRVAAAAVRGLRLAELVVHIRESDTLFLADLCLGAPDSHALLREEAALFVDQCVLEGAWLVPDLPRRYRSSVARSAGDEEKFSPAAASQAAEITRQRHVINVTSAAPEQEQLDVEKALITFASYLAQRVAASRMHLVRRFVTALWGRAPCLSSWATMVDLILLGEGGGAANGLRPLDMLQRLALVHIMAAALLCAIADDPEEGTLRDAVTVLVPRLARLLVLCAGDEATMVPLAVIVRLAIEHAYGTNPTTSALALDTSLAAPPRTLVAALRRSLSLPISPCTTSFLIDAILVLARRSSEALTETLHLTAELRNTCEELLREIVSSARVQDERLPGLSGNLSACLGRLLVVGNRGIDILCAGTGTAGPQYVLLQRALHVLDLERRHLDGRDQAASLGPAVIVQLLELAFLLIAWRVRAVASLPGASQPQEQEKREGQSSAGNRSVHVTALDRTELPMRGQQLRDLSIHFVRLDKSCGAVRLQGFSVYTAMLQLTLGTSAAFEAATKEVTPPYERREQCHAGAQPEMERCFARIPRSHLNVLENAAREVISQAQSAQSKSHSSVHTSAVQADGQWVDMPIDYMLQVTTVRRLLTSSYAGKEDPEAVAGALAVCRMIAESEHECIYGCALGRLVLTLATGDTVPKALQAVAMAFARRLRRLACVTHSDATRYFSIVLAAVALVSGKDSEQAGAGLANIFLAEVE